MTMKFTRLIDYCDLLPRGPCIDITATPDPRRYHLVFSVLNPCRRNSLVTRPGHVSQNHHTPITRNVIGIVMATYNHHLVLSKDDIPKTDDKNVPGRKTIVKAAMIFMDVPSAFASRAMEVLVVASCCVTRLKTFELLVL